MSRTLPLPLLMMLVAGKALAQREPPDEPKVADDGGAPRIYFAHSYDEANWNGAGLGNRISVHVQNFGKLLEKAGGVCGNLVLFIEGMPIRGLKPESCDQAHGHVRFLLQRTEPSGATWTALLGAPRHYAKGVGISIGTDDQFSIDSSVDDFQLIVVPPVAFWGFVGVALALLAFFIWLSSRTGLIRAGGGLARAEERPYSLGMFQMVFWLYLVLSAYVFIWLVMGELDTITESVLALLGVGTGTALSATLIDNSAKKKKAAAKTRGFMRDLLDDGDTVCLSRFQLFLWTVALGFIFCRSVYNNLHMPEFSATLLALMGISSGTYLGFKTQKGRAGAPDQAAEAASPS